MEARRAWGASPEAFGDADATEDRQEQGSVADRNEAERDLARTYTGVADGFAADCILGGPPA